MKLNSIRLTNYRIFSEVECPLDPKLTVFVATNGCGKTSMLDAIKISFDTYLGAFPTGLGQGIKVSDVRLKKINAGGMEPVFPVAISASGVFGDDQNEKTWARKLNSAKSKTTVGEGRILADYARQLQDLATADNDRTTWPLLAYYGTGRLWNRKKLTSNKQFVSGYYSRAAGYLDCMEPASSYKLFLDWFHDAYRANASAKIRFMEANPNASAEDVLSVSIPKTILMHAVRDAVNTVLAPSGWKNLWYSESLGDATAFHDEFGQLAISQLSDGIRNTIALVADIAFRAVQLNGGHLGAEAPKQTRGVVLIDEIDMHLHPSWQQQILQNLTDAFPNIQFIVTTHSPQVLTTVKPESIRALAWQDGKIVVRSDFEFSEGAEAQVVLEEIFQTMARPDIQIVKDLKEYLELVSNNSWDSPRALELRSELDAWGHGHETALLKADVDIRLKNYRRQQGTA
ncbi:AAA family ATPase [Massilia sp. MB5]|uniref:AAA family ATPase n=1 Tax=Massilia sp. MB5 TaxID=2919578 RepID=UPI001F0CE0F5|nr:AAA family ATPase [Massilia sp. MB5]UMR31059.1 AAA family ATPase [Massilia sp. MB5]